MSERGNGRGTDRADARGVGAGLRVQMLGPLALFRDGQLVSLPASRKLRALLAYLALSPRSQGRSQLCELLWEGPSDPRGELRWCLSRIRSAIDTPAHARVITDGDTVALDLRDAFVDVVQIAQASREGVETLSPQRQRELAELFQGDFLEGLDIEDSPTFGNWLAGQRRRLRGCHAALLEQLATRVADEEALGYLEKWLQLTPFDRSVHESLLTILARTGRLREGEEHVAAAAALFDAEGLDWTSVREAWRSARAGHASPSGGSVAVEPRQVVLVTAGGDLAPAPSRRASIAVMPFADESVAPRERGGAADALAHDVTTRLAKLRSMFVIAQGSTFALHERRIGPEEAGRMLNVDYVVSGSVRMVGERLRVGVELVETRTARIVWSEVLNHGAGDTFQVLDEIGNQIVAAIAGEIETIERNRAILRPPNSLDAWEAHHRGLWHMYRFTRDDNARARHFFETAVRLDPTFARAHAGLSFTHFQDAFQGWAERAPEVDSAFASAGQALLADDRDPAAHWAMGRALWLRGSDDQAMTELQRSIELSPNFALAHYMLAFMQSQVGDAAAAIASSDCSRNLSPFDPLLFAMFGARALALARLGRFEESAAWAVKAAARPNAHAHIYAMAAYTLALAGSADEARVYAAATRKMWPRYAVADFLGAFRFASDGEALFRTAAKRVGMT